ncbi:MAG: DUF1080 domain-containing protein [Candidatus Marinimicrobia bacterium]|nr:DUF1080 domain-containing protein [Candidatus Neomarinimicrobiota bacterium]RKY60809.1 MAG: DUF1080 domain-containing protein [Candidatus Neomarinimicrobiota bacterium]
MLGCSLLKKGGDGAAVSLFDGKTLTGWDGDRNWFHVEDGCIVAGSLEKEIPHNMFLCTTKEYDDFELKLEIKIMGPGDNSGIQFRSRRIPGGPEVSGYQADAGGPIGDFGVVWGSLYDEARRNRMLVTANQEEIVKVYRQNEWNEMVVKCRGNHIQIWLNGYQTVDYTEEDDTIPKKGIIGFQLHAGAPTEVRYRNIKLTEL